MDGMSAYERRALDEIRAWKSRGLGPAGRVLKTLNKPLAKFGDASFSVPVLGWILRRVVEGLVSLANDLAQHTVRPKAIYRRFRRRGYGSVDSADDIANLDLEDVDRVLGRVKTKYKLLAAGEGAIAGMKGALALPPDVIALVTLNLRAIGEYATYYGFDIEQEEERLYAMHVLAMSSSPDDTSKAMAVAQLTRIANDIAKQRTWKELQRHTFVRVVERIAKVVGVRLTKAKLAQSIPLAGAVFGGGFNAYFTEKVCVAAYFLYRERFLARRHGPQAITGATEAAEGVEPEYFEVEEADVIIEQASDDVMDQPGAGPPEIHKVLVDGLKEFASQHPSWEKLAPYFPDGLADQLPKGRYPLEQALIHQHVSKHLEPDAVLNALTCRQNGMLIDLNVPRSGIRPQLAYEGLIFVEELELTRGSQHVLLRTLDEQLRGGPIVGWIVAPVVQAILKRVYGGVLNGGASLCRPEHLNVEVIDGGCLVELSEVPVIRRLARPVFHDKGVLDLVAINGCEHDDGQLLLQGTLPPRAQRPSR